MVTTCLLTRTIGCGGWTLVGPIGSGGWSAATATGDWPTWKRSCGWRTPDAQQRSNMSDLRLTGLAGAHPLGALAAFGLLRCCEEMEGFRGSRLGWRAQPDWFAVLETDGSADPESLVAALVTRQQGRSDAPELNWARTIKAREDYLRAA